MPDVDVLQEMFVAADPSAVTARFARSDVTALVWPDLTVTVTQQRGPKGTRYAVAGSWQGTAEFWLQRCLDGVLVHSFLRVDRAGGRRVPRGAQRRRDAAMRRALWRVKDELEAGRAPGAPVRRRRRR